MTPDFLEDLIPLVREVDELRRELEKCIQSERNSRAAYRFDGHHVDAIVPDAETILPLIERIRKELMDVASALDSYGSFDPGKSIGSQTGSLLREVTALKKAVLAREEEW